LGKKGPNLSIQCRQSRGGVGAFSPSLRADVRTRFRTDLRESEGKKNPMRTSPLTKNSATMVWRVVGKKEETGPVVNWER